MELEFSVMIKARSAAKGPTTVVVTVAVWLLPVTSRSVVELLTVATLVIVPGTVGLTLIARTTAELEPKSLAGVVTTLFEKTGALNGVPGEFVKPALTKVTPGGSASDNFTCWALATVFVSVTRQR